MSKMTRRDFFRKSAVLGTGLVAGVSTADAHIKHRTTVQRPKIVRAYSSNATSWDYSSNYYFDYVDQEVVNDMITRGVNVLTNNNPQQLLERYTPGDKWAIKINHNNYSNASNEIDATAPSINAVLRLLVEDLGVPETDIYVYDCSRPIPDYRVRSRILYDVVFVQSGDALAQADYSAPISFRHISTQYMPLVLSTSQHLINIPLFKDHLFCLSTMAFKNHLGTTKPGPSYLHSPINENLSDLNASTHIRDKTRLLVGDALFGVWDGGPYGWPMQWSTFPGGPTPNSIFLGLDPVAHESVMVDYLIAEQEYHNVYLLSHNFLHDAMEYHGLGIHEHRDESGKYRSIRYVELEI